jgi:hypothetical protein
MYQQQTKISNYSYENSKQTDLSPGILFLHENESPVNYSG